MNEVSISKRHLMAMRASIAALLILVIVLFLKLSAEPPKIPTDFGEFERILAKETTTGATIIDITGKVTPFTRYLRPAESCGQSQPNEETTFPVPCRPQEGSTLLFTNIVTLMVYGKEKDRVTNVILGTGDPKYFPLPHCPDGGPAPC